MTEMCFDMNPMVVDAGDLEDDPAGIVNAYVFYADTTDPVC